MAKKRETYLEIIERLKKEDRLPSREEWEANWICALSDGGGLRVEVDLPDTCPGCRGPTMPGPVGLSRQCPICHIFCRRYAAGLSPVVWHTDCPRCGHRARLGQVRPKLGCPRCKSTWQTYSLPSKVQ
jgi:hypothetical protein